MTSLPVSERARVRRLPKRAHYDRQVIDSVLDAGFVCHVGYAIDGTPYVTPTLYWREDDHVYWHGSSASRMLRASAATQACLTVTHIDGLVLARSGFHHSANYRSVMLFGAAQEVTDENDKRRHLDRFIDGLLPGRTAQLRPATAQELKATTLLSLKIEEGSAKIRSGPPVDDEADYALPVWAGIVPLRMTAGAPEPCARLAAGTEVPGHVRQFAARLQRDAE